MYSELLYVNEVFSYKKLAEEEIKELILRANCNDIESIDLLILTQQRLVCKVANQFKLTNNIGKMDLIQEGNMGLLEAIKTFDDSKGYKFSTYAYRIIKNKMIDAINNQSDLIIKSVYVKSRKSLYPKAELSLDHNDFVKYHRGYIEYSNNYMPTPIQAYLSNEKRQILESSLNSLNSKEKHFLCLYFGLYSYEKHTYQQIADIYNISKAAVYQRIKKILKKLESISLYFKNI